VGTLLKHETAERKRNLSLDASDGLDALDFRWLDRRAFRGANVTLCCSVFALARSADFDRDDYRDPFRGPQAWSPHGVCNSGGAFVVRFAEHVNIDEIDCDRGARFFCVFGFCRIGRISSVVCSIANCFGKRRDDRHLRRRDCSCPLRRVTSEKAGCEKVGYLKGWAGVARISDPPHLSTPCSNRTFQKYRSDAPGQAEWIFFGGAACPAGPVSVRHEWDLLHQV
jgi:hypothetical protein